MDLRPLGFCSDGPPSFSPFSSEREPGLTGDRSRSVPLFSLGLFLGGGLCSFSLL